MFNTPDQIPARVANAARFTEEIQPREGVDYSWVFKYAQEAYNDSVGRSRILDQKAERLIGFTGTATGVFAAVLSKADGWVIVAGMFPIALAILAVYSALRTLWPQNQAAPPLISTAWEYAEFFREGGSAAFVAEFHKAREYQTMVNETKAKHLHAAFWRVLGAMILLLSPLAASLWQFFAP